MITRSVVALLLLPWLAAGLALPASATSLYVATNGKDTWSGTLPAPNRASTDGPFATLQRAQQAVRQLRQQAPDQPVTVNLRGGMYRITKTLELSAKDSGTATAPVVWQAMPGETVRLVGGAQLTGWQRVTDPAVLKRLKPAVRSHVLQVDLKAAGVKDFGRPAPKGGPLAQLVCNGKYMTLARYPNVGHWLKIAGIPKGGKKYSRPDTNIGTHWGRFTYSGNEPSHWHDVSNLWVHGYWVWDWSDDYEHVEKLDVKKKAVWPQPPYSGYGYRRGQRFYFLNILEELDSPGEWYLDRKTGMLYFWPPCNIRHAEVFFPELQVPMLVLNDTQYVHICGLTFECSRDQAIILKGGSHNEIAGCTIRNFGAQTTVSIDGADNGIRSCDIYQVSGTGVQLGGGDRQTLTPAHNYAINCEIHHVGQVYRTYHGAFQLEGVGNRIAHCYIHDVPHEAIGYGGNDQIVEYCEFTRIAQETGDVGVLYTGADWTYMGEEFRYNYFHNIHGPGNLGCNVIYPDLPCGGIHLHHNIFYDCDQGFYTNSGRAMLIENNLFLRCGKSMGFGVWTEANMFKKGGAWHMVEHLQAVHYDQPPYSTRYPALKQLADDFSLGVDHILQRELPKDNVIRRNVSWGGMFLHLSPQASFKDVQVQQNVIADDIVFTGTFDGKGKAATYRNGDPAIAKELGQWGNIIVHGNPGLGDLSLDDFTFDSGSPARQIHFDYIPFRHIGLELDKYRKSLPLRVDDPLITPASRTFLTSVQVRLLPIPEPTPQPMRVRLVVRYTLDGSEPTEGSAVYRGPIEITHSTVLKAAAYVSDGRQVVRSNTVTATYKQMGLGRGGVYLSDLPEHDLVVYLPCWKKDTNYRGGPIELGGVQYAKGLLLHPQEMKDGHGRGQVVYELNGPLRRAKRFRAVIGIDDAMKSYNLGSATFIVEVHRNGKWERVFHSPVMRVGGQPEQVNVSVAGADELRLVTTDAGDGISCDHAEWAEARLE